LYSGNYGTGCECTPFFIKFAGLLNTSAMKKLNLILACLLLSTAVFSQQWKPKLTEQWEPVPEMITPGVGTAPPSDAIILFD